MKQHIPNTITSFNLFSGCIGVVLAFEGQLINAGYAIIIAAIFDFLDGMAARLLKVNSPVGKELDSLADMISFGFLPSVIVFMMLETNPAIEYGGSWIKYSAFLLAVFSALRLAKFNLDSRQTSIFIGLPTPACALFILSLPHIALSKDPIISAYVQHPVILLALILALSFLLVAEIPLMSLKFKDLQLRTNLHRYILLLVSVILLLLFQLTAIPFIIIFYLVLSLMQYNKLTQEL
ncbi:CDP-alcohol phosphatidyltransferase family protein [Olivibacter sp. 47]|jgi:CDP-diacylglycerol--serine O-phosphatidyltransferase|uniref:CDP-alcohol phosphatidyltransferase n=1 Tax=Sphingobacterium sp. (strain 21) TaxID=743722 RepID=F4C635_SPHS2|nr:CDP-alcohol phosphatidyltransferase family protein [Olivibacter sp. 47]MDM8175751.1 CDP-alcohol phosphatidyltransferase family protein [Olivibacter sp. 47]